MNYRIPLACISHRGQHCWCQQSVGKNDRDAQMHEASLKERVGFRMGNMQRMGQGFVVHQRGIANKLSYMAMDDITFPGVVRNACLHHLTISGCRHVECPDRHQNQVFTVSAISPQSTRHKFSGISNCRTVHGSLATTRPKAELCGSLLSLDRPFREIVANPAQLSEKFQEACKVLSAYCNLEKFPKS